MWLVKRKLTAGQASYSVLRVDIDDKLQTKLKTKITNKIQDKRYRCEEYSFVSADQDDCVLTIDIAETDFKMVQDEMAKGLDNPKVTTYDELLNSWGYVVELKGNNGTIYGFRKINSITRAKKVRSMTSLLFKDQFLIDLDEAMVFTIDMKVDFFAYNGTIFISNKKEFENALNFRKGMESNRDAVLTEFATLGIFNDVPMIARVVGINLNMLRKVSTIQKSGYYRNELFMRNLIKLNATEKWGLVVKNNQIVVTEENVGLILTLLNNSRLKSPINQEVFDATVKKKVE
jgi:hypothetical protein